MTSGGEGLGRAVCELEIRARELKALPAGDRAAEGAVLALHALRLRDRLDRVLRAIRETCGVPPAEPPEEP